ncbi:hypothetical protein MLV07_22665, partial [Escherichia coli]|nr:hypothetical protein [Escherichia coli]
CEGTEATMSVKDFTPTLEIKFHRRRWRIMVGRSSLASFRSEQDAIDALNKRRSFYEYWAGSAGVQAENTEPVIVHVTY